MRRTHLMADAEGRLGGVPCPNCGDRGTITYGYTEGFDELECPNCGYTSDSEELDALGYLAAGLPEPRRQEPGSPAASSTHDSGLPPYPRRNLKA